MTIAEQTAIPNYRFNFKSKASDVIKNIDMTGKTVIVTGGYSGIGLETVRAFVSAGANVIVPARRPEKAKEVLIPLIKQSHPGQIEIASLDLIDPDSIHQFAQNFLNQHDKLDLLINNAGIMYVPLRRDKRGLESHFAINHLGHYQLTLEILPALKKAAKQSDEVRIINLSSRASQDTPLLQDWNFANETSYTPQDGYQQSKTATMLFTLKLDALSQKDNIRSFAVHPGFIPTSNIGREIVKLPKVLQKLSEKLALMHLVNFFTGLFVAFDRSKYRYFKIMKQGAATQVWAATSPDLQGKGGLYLEDCNIGTLLSNTAPANTAGGVREYALDSKEAQRLWNISLKYTSLDYE